MYKINPLKKIMIKKNILHLTHTDIESDSRILKEIESLISELEAVEIAGIGVRNNRETHKTKETGKFSLNQIALWSRNWNFLPDIIRHSISLIEIIFKMTYKGIKNKPDIIHCHDTLVLPVGVLVKKFTGAKLIYDAHELESNRNGLSPLLGKITLSVEKILWRFVDKLIVVSPSIENWYKNNVGAKETTVVLNSPVLKNNNVEYDKTYLQTKFNIPIEKKIFLYIGVIGVGRGVDFILEAFAKKEIESHLVFLGFGELVDKVNEYAVKYNNIHYHEAVPHKDVVPIAKSASVGLCFVENVSLSDYYCLPNKLFEYAFSEIPVLASNFPDIKAVIKSFGLGECSDLDASSIYSTIKRFENMDSLPNIEVSKLYELSWQAQESKLVALYKSIL